MAPTSCEKCAGFLRPSQEEVPFESKLIGKLSAPGVEHYKCDKCGNRLISYVGATALFEYVLNKETETIKTLPVGDFFSANQAAEVLGFTKQAFSKNPRIKRGFIISIVVDGKRLYNKKSVELYKETADGRYFIKQTVTATRWTNVVHHTPSLDIYPNIEEPRQQVRSPWSDVPINLLQSADNYSQRGILRG